MILTRIARMYVNEFARNENRPIPYPPLHGQVSIFEQHPEQSQFEFDQDQMYLSLAGIIILYKLYRAYPLFELPFDDANNDLRRQLFRMGQYLDLWLCNEIRLTLKEHAPFPFNLIGYGLVLIMVIDNLQNHSASNYIKKLLNELKANLIKNGNTVIDYIHAHFPLNRDRIIDFLARHIPIDHEPLNEHPRRNIDELNNFLAETQGNSLGNADCPEDNNALFFMADNRDFNERENATNDNNHFSMADNRPFYERQKFLAR